MTLDMKWFIVQLTSLLRPLSAFMFYVIFNKTKPIINYEGILLFFVVFITDFLDGSLARYWKVTSKFGSLLDPICDKVSIYLLFLALFTNKPWVFYLMIGKDILVFTFGLYTQYKYTKAILTQIGKSTMAFTGIYLTLVMFYYFNYKYSPNLNHIPGTNMLYQLVHLSHNLAFLSIITYIIQFLYLFYKLFIKSKNIFFQKPNI